MLRSPLLLLRDSGLTIIVSLTQQKLNLNEFTNLELKPDLSKKQCDKVRDVIGLSLLIFSSHHVSHWKKISRFVTNWNIWNQNVYTSILFFWRILWIHFTVFHQRYEVIDVFKNNLNCGIGLFAEELSESLNRFLKQTRHKSRKNFRINLNNDTFKKFLALTCSLVPDDLTKSRTLTSVNFCLIWTNIDFSFYVLYFRLLLSI